MHNMTNIYKILVGKGEKKRRIELQVDENILLKCISEKQDYSVYICEGMLHSDCDVDQLGHHYKVTRLCFRHGMETEIYTENMKIYKI
jgi:hypothetical protein